MENFDFLGSLEQEAINGGKALSLLQTSGLDWKVNKVPLATPDGVLSGYYANQRQDKGTVLGVFKESYNVYQNEDLAELCFYMAKEFDLSLERGGSLNEGRKVYIQLQAGQITGIGENDDTIKNYITAINSHDGSTCVSFGTSNITISCQNTFFAAHKQLKNKIKHTDSMQMQIETAKRDIEGVQKEQKTLYETFFKLAEIPANKTQIQKIVKSITDVDIIGKRDESLSTRKWNQATDLTSAIAREFKQKGETLWGLFNGVTRYTSHDLSIPNRENARIESQFFGSGASINTEAYEMIKEFAFN